MALYEQTFVLKDKEVTVFFQATPGCPDERDFAARAALVTKVGFAGWLAYTPKESARRL